MQAPLASSLDNNNGNKLAIQLVYITVLLVPVILFISISFYIYPLQSLPLTHTTIFTIQRVKLLRNVIELWISMHVVVCLSHL